MKKSRLLALTLVVAVMLVGAGYAYWQEALTINTTVDTGDLEVIFQEPADVIDEGEYQPNADCSITTDSNKKGMTVTFKEVYPGLENTFYFDLVNKGTLGAYVDDFGITSLNENLDTDLILCKEIKINNYNIGFTGKTLEQALKFINNYGDKKGIKVDTQLVEPAPNAAGYSYTPGIKQVKFVLQFDPKAKEVDFSQNTAYSFDITANVHQFNGR